MPFQNRSQFTSAATSEKTVLAHIQATSRLYNWTVYSGNVYKRDVAYFVYKVKQGETALTKVNSIGAIVAGTYYYNIDTNELYIETVGSVNPTTVEIIATYQFFYSTSTINAPWNLIDGDNDVLYQGRITNNPGYKHKVGIEQNLSSLVGSGNLVLENNDGGLDDIFDTLFFENQECRVYSWNRDLPFADAKLLYRGKVTNKSYDSQSINFTIKDQMFDLEQSIPQSLFDDSYDVNDNVKSTLKRWVYGRVDGLIAQSIDQIGTGYQITGTVSANTSNETMTGSGTFFLSELSPGDTLTVEGNEFNIEAIVSNTQLTLNEIPEFSFSGKVAALVPEIPTVNKNRVFFVADHACTKIVKTLVSIIQINRIELNNTDDLYAGDFVEFDTGEKVQIKNIAPGNIIVLTQALVFTPTISSDVIRQPIQSVFIEGRFVRSENYTITNIGAPTNHTLITLSNDAEFDLAKAKDLGVQLTFTNGSRVVTTAESVDLRDFLSPRDWIRPADIAYTAYYEVLSVGETSLELRIDFDDPTITDDTQAKTPDYIGDDTVVSVNVLGRTVTGEPSGLWIRSAAQVVKDLINEIGITNINTQSFDDANESTAQLMSLALPLSRTSGLTKTKDAIDLINKSVYGSLTLDADLDVQYRILKNDIPATPRVIKDSDVVDWKIKTTNGKGFRNTIIKYRHQDYNKDTKQDGTSIVSHSSNFVRDYIGTNQTSEFAVYLYDTTAAQIMAHRYVYFNRLGRADITIESDLRLEDIEIGDVIQLEFSRLYKRFGDNATRKKLMLVIGLTKNGERITLEATDLNNTFNSSAVITPNTANDYVDATLAEKLKYGYITTDQGIVNEEETTANINLIS